MGSGRTALSGFVALSKSFLEDRYGHFSCVCVCVCVLLRQVYMFNLANKYTGGKGEKKNEQKKKDKNKQ